MKEAAKSFIVPIVVSYLMFAFVLNEYNPSAWSENSRVAMLLIAAPLYLIFVIYYNIDKK